jgi:L-threonylcarbamoyladenylate synthase
MPTQSLLQTRLTTSPAEAAAILRRGGLVAFPTETVFGLGADVFQPAAVEGIFRAKERPADNPLIVHVAHKQEIGRIAAVVSPLAHRLIDTFFPGPLTLVLPRHPDVPAFVSAGLDTVAVRMPGHPIARAFLAACDTPVAAPSANRSGRPSPTTWEDVRADLAGRIDAILQGPPADVGLESTVVDLTSDPPLLLRPGAASLEALREVAPEIALADPGRVGSIRSPGLKHRHYAPDARVVLVDDPREAPADPSAAFIGLTPHPMAGTLGLHVAPTDVADYAHRLFHFLRQCDRTGIAVVCAQRVPPVGLGRALMDRLERAAKG